MSLFGSLFSSVSALSAQSKSMSMISDNVANVNTTAYKKAEADFSSLVTRRPSSQSYTPGGVRAFTSYQVEQQGLIQSSASPTDVAISGSGFFVVNRSNGADGTTQEQLYTRAGSFEPDFLGDLRTPSGFYLQGWALDADEEIADINVLETVNIRQVQGIAAATTQVSIGANLDADETHGDDGTSYDPDPVMATGNSMAEWNATTLAGGAPTGFQPSFSRDLQVYDSLGRARTITVGFLKDTLATNPNEWFVEVYADPSTLNVAATHAGQLAAGKVTFDDKGAIATVSPALTSITADWANADGAADSTIAFDWGAPGTTTSLTQFSSANDVRYVAQNGAEVGELNGVWIDDAGYVVANFTNGEQTKLYKLPVATFPNPSALDPRSGNVYSQTEKAGEYNLRFAGVGGAGSITPSSLEAANVDIAEEFTKMIVTQRAYSASSKIISTADQLLEELLRIAG